MTRNLSSTQTRARLGTLLDDVSQGGDTVIIEKNGKAAAALVPVEMLDHLIRARHRAIDEIRRFRANVKPPAGDIDQVIDREVAAVRRGRRTRPNR